MPEPAHGIYKKTMRNCKNSDRIDMREKPPIEEELVNVHEEIYSKKELCDKRMASRDLAIQGLCNPFMIKNNYLEDLDNQDQFLRVLTIKSLRPKLLSDFLQILSNESYLQGDIFKALKFRLEILRNKKKPLSISLFIKKYIHF